MELLLHLYLVTGLALWAVSTVPLFVELGQLLVAVHAEFVSYHIGTSCHRARPLRCLHGQPLLVCRLLRLGELLGFNLLFVLDVIVAVSEVLVALETRILLLILMLLDWHAVPILRL